MSIAAIGDLHMKADGSSLAAPLSDLRHRADFLLVAGDLTDTGRIVEAEAAADLLAAAQEHTGEGVTETLRQGLEKLAHQAFYDRLRALKGKVKFDVDLEELREDREFDEHGNVL